MIPDRPGHEDGRIGPTPNIWPFHAPALPLVLEIYPRALTGPVTKSSQADRERYLARGFPEIDGAMRRVAASSEDAFDAAVSAVVMARARAESSALRPAQDDEERLEGGIWWPETPPAPLNQAPAGDAVATDAPCPEHCRRWRRYGRGSRRNTHPTASTSG